MLLAKMLGVAVCDVTITAGHGQAMKTMKVGEVQVRVATSVLFRSE